MDISADNEHLLLEDARDQAGGANLHVKKSNDDEADGPAEGRTPSSPLRSAHRRKAAQVAITLPKADGANLHINKIDDEAAGPAEGRTPSPPLRSAHRRKAAQVAITLLKSSPYLSDGNTPPSRNTRSTRRQPLREVGHNTEDKELFDENDRQAGSAQLSTKKAARATKVQRQKAAAKFKVAESHGSEKKRAVRPRKIEAKRRPDTNDEENKTKVNPEDDRIVKNGTTDLTFPLHEDSLVSPALNIAMLKTPFVDMNNRQRCREEIQQDTAHDSISRPLSEARRRASSAPCEVDELCEQLESTAIRPDRPVLWSLRRLSPITGQEGKREQHDEESLSESTSTEGHDEALEKDGDIVHRRDVAVQTSFCSRCSAVGSWRDLKPLVMVFVLLMLTLLYKGVLRTDPKIGTITADGLGMMAQGSFLASFSLEDYVADIFHR